VITGGWGKVSVNSVSATGGSFRGLAREKETKDWVVSLQNTKDERGRGEAYLEDMQKTSSKG